MRFELPKSVKTREDGLRLWLHLVELDVRFHWDEDPEDFIDYSTRKRAFKARKAKRLRNLLTQARECDDQRVLRDAFRLSRIARTIGPNVVDFFDLNDVRASYEKLRRLRDHINRFIVAWRA